MSPAEHPFLRLIRDRVSVEQFDPSRTLGDEEIRGLVRDACCAPSSFNLQHWRFVAVRNAEDKRRLKEAAYGQEQVETAAVTFIILGDLQGEQKHEEVMQAAVENGVMPQGRADAWVRMAREIYADPANARDEVIRSGSLVAMVMMLAAEARGLATGALSGFDVEQVKQAFDVDDRYVPVLLLAVGHPLETGQARMPRLPVDQVLAFDRAKIW